MHRLRNLTFASFAVLAIALTACSGGKSNDTSSQGGSATTSAADSGGAATTAKTTALDPCSVLTSAQVGAALSRPVGTPTTIKVTPVPPNGSACNWEATAKQGELIFRTARVDLWKWSDLPSDWRSTNPSPTAYANRICEGKDVVATKIDIPGFVACRTEFLTYVANDKYLAIVGVPNLANSPEAETASVQLAKDVAAHL